MIKSPVVERIKVISNPFADPDENDSAPKHGQMNDSGKSEDRDEHKGDKLGDLQENIEDVYDQSSNRFKIFLVEKLFQEPEKK